jgi:hypothetical protein
MNARDNMLAFGFQSLVAFSAPAFAGHASSRGASDYFLEAGEYLGRGFSQVVHEAQDQPNDNQEQLDLFEARRDH